MLQKTSQVIALSIMLISSAFAGSLETKILTKGKGAIAKVGDTVTVHYSGWLLDGTQFDSSRSKTRKPFSFTIGEHRVIKGWEQGVAGMAIGEKRELIIPPELAYGNRAVGGVIKANSTLKFEVELLEIEKPKYSNVGNEEFKALLKKDIPVFDIRLPEEWKETGIVEGSIMLTFFDKTGRVNPKFLPEFNKIITKKDQEFALICRTGSRTGAVSKMLDKQLGQSNFYNVTNGITHWIREGNPVKKIN